jgi:putative flippase GtrA
MFLRRLLADAREPVMFLIVGTASAACYVALNVLFLRILDVRPGVAIVLAMLTMTPPNYLAQRILTFRSHRRHLEALPRYLATQAFSNLIGALLSELFARHVTAQPWVAFTLIAVIVAATNYSCMKFWTFVSPDLPNAQPK